MKLEEQNREIMSNIKDYSIETLNYLLKQVHSYNTALGVYNDMVEVLENELANRR